MGGIELNDCETERATGIGGYFELECPQRHAEQSARGYQSARAACASLLLQTGVKRARLPYFLCDSVAEELRRVGIDVAGYSLESDLSPRANPARDMRANRVGYVE